jgi:transposase
MTQPLSVDLRQRAVEAYIRWEGTLAEIAERFQIGTGSLKRFLRLHIETGSLEPKPHGGGRPRSILPEEEGLVLEFLEQKNDLTLGEIRVLFREKTGKIVSESVFSCLLSRLDWTRKKKRSTHPNRNAPKSSKQEKSFRKAESRKK